MISNEIRAAQEAYASLPVSVRWVDSHTSIVCKFNNFDEAFDYIQTQWKRIQKTVATQRFYSSALWRSYVEAPRIGRVQLAYVLLSDDVSSY